MQEEKFCEADSMTESRGFLLVEFYVFIIFMNSKN